MIPNRPSPVRFLVWGNTLAVLLSAGEAGLCGSQDVNFTPSTQLAYLAPERIAELENREIKESSGIAPSRRHKYVFWTHNDSGDKPRLFAFDLQGRHLATVKVDVKKAHDWEDIASFEHHGKSYLLIGDVGNSRKQSNHLQLHLVPEPQLPQAPKRIHPLRTVDFRFDSGTPDCESVAYDVTQGKVLLATKSDGLVSRIFELNWPADDSRKHTRAQLIATIAVPAAVAMDISADARHAIVLSYVGARLYTRAPSESWRDAFSRTGKPVRMPPRRQGEAVCFGADDLTLYLTSEKLPTPLFQIKTAPAGPTR